MTDPTTDPPAPLPFFVYGTLRPGGRHHAWALRGRTAAEEPAELSGAMLYEGPGYPYAVRTPERPRETVRGTLVRVVPAAYPEVLAALDRLEGYAGPGDGANLYDRVTAWPVRHDGVRVRAWLYAAAPRLAARLRASGRPVPGGDWLRG